MDEFGAYLRALPWKDWSAPLIAGSFALLGGLLAIWSKVREARHVTRDADAKAQKDREHTYDTTQTIDLTSRLKILMEGYENRIRELSEELKATKDELREYQNASRHTPRRS